MDSKLAHDAPTTTLIDALTYRIELAERMDDDDTARMLDDRLATLCE